MDIRDFLTCSFVTLSFNSFGVLQNMHIGLFMVLKRSHLSLKCFNCNCFFFLTIIMNDYLILSLGQCIAIFF